MSMGILFVYNMLGIIFNSSTSAVIDYRQSAKDTDHYFMFLLCGDSPLYADDPLLHMENPKLYVDNSKLC